MLLHKQHPNAIRMSDRSGNQKRWNDVWVCTCCSCPRRSAQHAVRTPDSVAPARELVARLPALLKHASARHSLWLLQHHHKGASVYSSQQDGVIQTSACHTTCRSQLLWSNTLMMQAERSSATSCHAHVGRRERQRHAPVDNINAESTTASAVANAALTADTDHYLSSKRCSMPKIN